MTDDDMTAPATKADLAELRSELRAELAAKDDLATLRAALRAELASKTDIADLRAEMNERFATKDDLQNTAHTIMGDMNMALEGFRADIARQIRASSEETRDWMRSLDDRYVDLPPRVKRLEWAVFEDES